VRDDYGISNSVSWNSSLSCPRSGLQGTTDAKLVVSSVKILRVHCSFLQ
jgi:hypothetical protein